MSAQEVSELELVIEGPEQMMALGRAVAGLAQCGDVIGLIGELGAGKTVFVRGLAEGLGIDPGVVSSPTFVFVQEYEPDADEQPVLVHIDAYRLTGPEQADTIGWTEGGAELRSGAVVAIEWAERVSGAIGRDWLEVSIEHAEAGRGVTLRGHGEWGQRVEGGVDF